MKSKIFVIVLVVLAVVSLVFCFTACGKAEDLIYEKPENIVYDGQYITWDKVEGAKHYMVSINGLDSVRSNSTTYAYTSDETFEVTVAAVFDKTEKSSSVTFKPLSSISNFKVSDNGEVSWEAVSGATAYAVNINGTVKNITDTHLKNLDSGSNNIKVKPIAANDDTYYSSYSKEVDVYIYDIPTNIKYDGEFISWTGDSSQYEVNIDGKIKAVTGNKCEYVSGGKDFSVSVKAIGNHTLTYDSKSHIEEYHYLPPITEIFVEDGVVKWNPVEKAEKYKIRIDNAEQSALLENTNYDALPSGKSVDVALMPINESGNYFSAWSSEKTIYILDTPNATWNNALKLDGQSNNNFHWDAVKAGAGYTVKLVTKIGDQTDEQTKILSELSYGYDYAKVGEYKISVKANAANGDADKYDSKFSNAITVRRLPAPKPQQNNFIVSNKDNLGAGFMVNYQLVNGATKYQLYKDGALLDGRSSTTGAISDTNVCDTSIFEEKKYNYYVRSLGGVKTVSENKEVTLPCLTTDALTFDITVLATPQNPDMEGYYLKWNPVKGSNGYSVAYSGNSNTSQTESYDLSVLQAGNYSVKVCARGDGKGILPSNMSSPISIQRLSAPENIRIMPEENGTLKCDEVQSADSYSAFFIVGEQSQNVNSFVNLYNEIKTTGTTMNMIANANKWNDINNKTLYYMSSQPSKTQQFIRLAQPEFPENPIENSNELIWNNSNNINTSEYTPDYEVFDKGKVKYSQVKTPKFNIEFMNGGEEYTFYIKAIGNNVKYLDSAMSEGFTIYKLKTPELKIADGQYRWNGVENAKGYYMEIDGKKVSDDFHISGETYSFMPRYTSIGDHKVSLIAVGDGKNKADGKPLEYTQHVEKLTNPVISYSYGHSAFVPNGEITVKIETQSKNCKGYEIEIGGVSSGVIEQLSYSKAIVSPGTYSIRARAVGENFDLNDVYYINSDFVGDNATDKIVLLSAPSGFSINTDGVISWKNVDGNLGYDYQIKFDDNAISELKHTGNSYLNPIEDFRIYYKITVSVLTKGDGDKIISSQKVEYVWANPNK